MKKPIIKEYSIKITETNTGIEEHIKHSFTSLYELLGVLEIEVMRLKIALTESRNDK
jgi:hypothetical protein